MATSLDVVNEWASDSEDKQTLVKTHSGLILRWLNQAQLRFADRSEMLKSRWTPTITSTGNIALPADFLREIPDRVQANVNNTALVPLRKVDYPDAVLITWASLEAYSIYNGTFYIWAASAATPAITYNKKPVTLTDLTTDLETPTMYHSRLIQYLDVMWARRKGEIPLGDQIQLLRNFDLDAANDGYKEKQRTQGLIMMRSSFF